MTTLFSRGFLTSLFFLVFLWAGAQENFEVYNEPGISINLGTENRWSHNFGIVHRRVVYENENFIFAAKHLELSHFTAYETGFYSKFGLGVKYQFIELFDESSHNELRITEQYSHSRKYNLLKIAHRVRLEERFQENLSFRGRYRLSMEIPLSGQRLDVSEFFVVAETEALWTFSKHARPELDQRFGLSIGKELAGDMKIEIGLEYQYENYTHDPKVDLFILSGISITL